ncbi:DNA methyltransferase [Enterococcus thailandicus]|uniref:DNA methyltransferase n=1 Tax=Enterococcus thailandicus TaxID=417368 RepID=UPI0035DFDD2B
MDTRLMQQIKEILKEFPQYWNGEELQRPIVIDDLKNYDALLISALLKNQKIRENYSLKAGDVVIFKVQEFIDILRYKDYWADSYTKYSNTIGLSSEGKYLQYNTDVVLDFPYKDCVLEGGMTKEDAGKEEVFYNEVIARDEIDTLLAPKAFVNVKKYDADGEHRVDTFSDEDNLIIKGNNLLALYSLKERYVGKVKCIYIDPPYNTGNDSFKYNDRFNHSTWLTFMKNRIEIAKELLSEDGTIFVHCDDNEQAYLKVLLGDIFGSENFLNTLSVYTKVSAGASGGGEDKKLKKNIEYIHIYTKNSKEFISFHPVYKKTELSAYINQMKQEGKSFKYTNVLVDEGEEKYFKTIKDGSGEDIVINKVENYRISTINQLSKEENLTIQETYDKYFDKVMTTTNAQTSIRTRVWEATDSENNMYTATYIPKTGRNKGKETKLIFYGKQKVLFIWLKDTAIRDGKKTYKKEKIGTFWDGFSWINVTKEGSIKFESGKKTEGLIQRIFEMSSDEKDIVLDFFMGSATTQSVAMKMNRRFIGIEQMDYINTVSVPRLQKVIEGEQGGISKDVNWQGGGSFIYAELMELNQEYMNKIDQASTKEELADLWDELDNNADLNFQLDKEKLTNELLKEHDEEEGSITFNDLTFEEQKEIFKKSLDKNQLYGPYSEIEDANVIISDNDKSFNHSFYSNEGE